MPLTKLLSFVAPTGGIHRGTALPLLQGLGVAVLALALLGACARTPVEPTLVVDTVDPGDAEGRPALPDVELTPALLYDILVGEIAQQRGQMDTSLESMSRAAFATQDPRLAARATRLALISGQDGAALDMARLWVRVDPDNAAANEALAQVLMGLGRATEAERHLVSLIRRAEPDVGPVYLRIGEIMSRQQQPGSLLVVMDRLVALHPESADAYYAKAFLASRLQQHDVVDAALNEALDRRPDWEDAAINKITNLAVADRDDEIGPFARQFLAANRNADALRMQYARLLLEQDQIKPALTQFRRVLKHEPENGDALYAAALLSIEEKDYRDAAELLERHLLLRPSHDQTRLYLGQVALERDQYAEARDWFEQVSDESLLFEAQVRVGGVLAAAGDTNEALEYLEQASWANDKQHVRLILAREEVLREAQRLPDAKVVLDEALQHLPDDPDLLYARGLIAAQLKLVDVHERDLRRLIAQEPENAHAYNALGYTLADLTDRYDEAFELITQALALKPDDPFIMDSMGWIQYRLGNHDQALDYLQRAFSIREDAEIAAHLGEVFWVTGKRRQAESVWRRGLKLGPDNDVLLGTIRKLKQ